MNFDTRVSAITVILHQRRSELRTSKTWILGLDLPLICRNLVAPGLISTEMSIQDGSAVRQGSGSELVLVFRDRLM